LKPIGSLTPWPSIDMATIAESTKRQPGPSASGLAARRSARPNSPSSSFSCTGLSGRERRCMTGEARPRSTADGRATII
jgi:hypothetical protein